MDHKWKNWLLAFWATVFLCLGSVFFFQVTVDPMGVWSAASTAGFNNFKTSQEQTERIFKIYQYRGYEPEVVFLGSSRVNYCMPPQWPGIPDDKVYNMGITAAHIPEESFYFDAMLDTHLPKIVAVGIDLLQFSSRYNKPHKGFSEDRLWMVSFSPFTSFVEKAKETVLSFDAVRSSIDVMEASEENPDATY